MSPQPQPQPSDNAAVRDAEALREDMAERFFAYDEIRGLPPADREALFSILLRAQQGDDSVLRDIYKLVYDELPVPFDEFMLGKKYLGLKNRVNEEKLYIMREFGKPEVRKLFCAAGSGGGKALALATPLPTPMTPTGWTTMGAVQPGDWVLDEHGRAVQVIGVSEVMTGRPCYNVVFDDGSTVVADEGHLWWTWDTGCRAGGSPAPRDVRAEQTKAVIGPQVRTTADIGATLLNPQGGANHSVRTAAPLQLPERFIVDVRPAPSVPVRCIQVDSPSHLYLAGKGMIPTHNSFMVSCVQAWEIYNLLCLKRPDLYFMLGPGSKIATVNLSVGKEQAKDVVFAEFIGRLSNAPWFYNKFRAQASRCIFAKNVFALSGGSGATSYYGYHTKMGCVDEASFMIDREGRSQVEELIEALVKSLTTRFPTSYKLMVISTLRDEEDYLYVNIERIKEDGVPLLVTTDVYA
ncbi:hypothetical protein BH24ACT15_BH24ACT15_33490 [soil metagenome]